MSIALLMILAACNGNGGDDAPSGDADADTDTDVDTDTDADTDTYTDTSTLLTETGTTSTGHTGSTFTGDTGPPLATIDCAALAPNPVSISKVANASAYHGIVFTDNGTLIGSDNNSLIEADAYGNASVFLPGAGRMEQLDRLADGTIIAGSDDNRLLRIETNGASTVLASIPSIYGVRVGPDGLIYVADWNQIQRVDPVNGTVTLWKGGAQFKPKVLDFNIDFTKMYVGTINDGGNVFEIDLDANYDPIGNPRLLASTPGSWHDGLAVDICGNIYVAEYNTSGMYRIAPSGQVGTLFIANNSGYGHGVVFGSGLGGFSETALYIPQPYDNSEVSEVEIGVPYRTYTGPVINGP